MLTYTHTHTQKPTVVLTEVLLHALLLLLRAAPQPPSPAPLMRALTSSASALHLLLLNASAPHHQSISSTDILRRVWLQVHALFAAASAPESELLPASEWLSAANRLSSRDAPLLRYFVWLACVRAFRRASLSPLATLEALAFLLKVCNRSEMLTCKEESLMT